MGYVNTRIVLKNIDDVKRAKKGQMPEQGIRQAAVDVLVNTGAPTLIINQDLFRQLGLEVIDEREITFANAAKQVCKLTEPVAIHWEDRFIPMPALVVEDAPDTLLGVLPLEGMDLMVDTVSRKLAGAHGDKPVYFIG
jgi:clan AA aspartic protease